MLYSKQYVKDVNNNSMNSVMYVIDFVHIICLKTRFTKNAHCTEDFRYLVDSLEYFTGTYLLLKERKTTTNIVIGSCAIISFLIA